MKRTPTAAIPRITPIKQMMRNALKKRTPILFLFIAFFYFCFCIKKEIKDLYKDSPSSLFKILSSIYYMHREDVNYGFNLFNQITFIDTINDNKIKETIIKNIRT